MPNEIDHPLESSEAREHALVTQLRKYLPQRVGVDRGFVVDAKGNTSKRQDVVIYDHTVEGQRLGLEILIRRQEPRVLLYCFKGSPHTLT